MHHLDMQAAMTAFVMHGLDESDAHGAIGDRRDPTLGHEDGIIEPLVRFG